MRYHVAWGPYTDEVEADTPDDAWANFCLRTPDATRHPKRFTRVVTVLSNGPVTIDLPPDDVSEPTVAE